MRQPSSTRAIRQKQTEATASRPGRTTIMHASRLTRRRFLATTAASTAVIAMPYVRGAYAAGKLSIGMWDHWVPGANNTSKAMIEEWSAREKVEVQVDYIPSQVNKLMLTIAAESQAKSGHDILSMPSWQ